MAPPLEEGGQTRRRPAMMSTKAMIPRMTKSVQSMSTRCPGSASRSPLRRCDRATHRSVEGIEGFAERYGPWALVVGASEGVGAAFVGIVVGLGLAFLQTIIGSRLQARAELQSSQLRTLERQARVLETQQWFLSDALTRRPGAST